MKRLQPLCSRYPFVETRPKSWKGVSRLGCRERIAQWQIQLPAKQLELHVVAAPVVVEKVQTAAPLSVLPVTPVGTPDATLPPIDELAGADLEEGVGGVPAEVSDKGSVGGDDELGAGSDAGMGNVDGEAEEANEPAAKRRAANLRADEIMASIGASPGTI